MRFVKYILALIILVILVWGVYHLTKTKKNVQETLPVKVSVAETVNELAGQDAQELALQKAHQWQPDAVLSYMNSGEINQTGKAVVWKLIFVSPTLKNKGYEVQIKNKEIISIQEIDYAGKGIEFPKTLKTTQEEAVEKVKNMEGYQNADIFGINAIYGSDGNVWYWGVETSKGTVSIKVN